MRFALLPLLFLILSAVAHASKMYRITGEVVGVTASTVSVRRGSRIFQFARSKHLGLPKKGDRITILYELDAKQISPAPQGAGVVPQIPDMPDMEEGPDVPSAPGILDDRAFYNARNLPRSLDLRVGAAWHLGCTIADLTNRHFSPGRKK